MSNNIASNSKRKVAIIITIIFTIIFTIGISFFGIMAFQDYQSKNVSKKLIKKDLIGATFSIDSIDVEVTEENLKSMELTDKEVETELGVRGCIYYGKIKIEEEKYSLEVPIEVYYMFNPRGRFWSLGYQEFRRRAEERVIEIKEEATEEVLRNSFVGQTISGIEVTEEIAKRITIDNIEEDENNNGIVYVDATLYDNSKTPEEIINIESTIKFKETGWTVSRVYGKREKNTVTASNLSGSSSNSSSNTSITSSNNSTTNSSTTKSLKETYLEKYNKLAEELSTLERSYSNSSTETEKKELANKKYSKWDEFLNEIWTTLTENMESSEFEVLTQVQISWITEKESIAKNKGGSLDSLEGLKSLSESTKSRCYTLINNYME